MNPRAEELIRLLALEPHPEGGYYRETLALHRPRDDGPGTLAQRADHDLLPACRRQLQGIPRARREGVEPVISVPADWWQAARPLGSYALCSCTVGPGFEFEDFSFLREHATAKEALLEAAPDLMSLL